MINVNLEAFLETLKKIFSTDEIDELSRIQEKTVNDLYSFKVEEEKFIIKILTRPPISEMDKYRLDKEAKLILRLASVKDRFPIPVPRIIHNENDTKKIGYKFIIMSYVDGETAENVWAKTSREEKSQFLEEFAKITSSIHKANFEMFGDIEEYPTPRRFYSLNSLLKANTRRYAKMLGSSKLLPIKLVSKTQNFIERNLEKTNFTKEPFLVHSDLNLSNILVRKEDNWKIKAILDFEWSYAADPIFDLFDIYEEWQLDSEQLDIFFTNYSEEKINLENFLLEKKIFHLIAQLATMTVGWVFFHPTEENITRVTNRIIDLLADDI